MENCSNVLIVDDIAQNIQISGNILQKAGYNVLAALNGDVALKILIERDIDLVLLDVSMPGLDGYQVCEIMKMNPRTKNIPVIFLTARSQAEDIVKGFQMGAVDYVTKPFEPTELLQRVENHVRMRKQQDLINKQNEELLSINRSLEEYNATKDKFFSIIAHDLKNPFTTIIGFSKLLLTNFRTLEESKIENFLLNIYNSSQNAYKLLENLLTWARSQTNKLEFNKQKIDLAETVAGVVNLLSDVASRKEIIIENKFTDSIFVDADKDMLETVFRNLISNALKFTNIGGFVTVGVVDTQNSTMLTICVEDSGIGMKGEVVENLFRIDKNISTMGTNNERGTGLGLILCKDFIEKHGGKIWVESEIDVGSKFFFTCPIYISGN